MRACSNELFVTLFVRAIFASSNSSFLNAISAEAVAALLTLSRVHQNVFANRANEHIIYILLHLLSHECGHASDLDKWGVLFFYIRHGYESKFFLSFLLVRLIGFNCVLTDKCFFLLGFILLLSLFRVC
jgi:hypothetical protein